MNRREFISTGIAAGAVVSAATTAQAAHHESGGRYKLKYAPHFGMFKHHAGEDLLDQLRFMADEGFTALEDNGMPTRDVETQNAIGKELERLGMTMGVFVAKGAGEFNTVTLASNDKDMRAKMVQDTKNAVEIAKRVNAQWCTVVPGHIDTSQEWDYQMANCIENLKIMSEICEPSGLIMVLEPLNWWRNHPGLFLSKIPQAYLICQAVGSPSCKILNDLYHQQITEGNLVPNLDRAWEEIAYFQVGDNPGRKEPTTGEINYKFIFRHLYQKGYTGIVGMEHGNSRKGKEGERAVIDAYLAVDNFEV
jgi:hydroxypyruvate isomerase